MSLFGRLAQWAKRESQRDGVPLRRIVLSHPAFSAPVTVSLGADPVFHERCDKRD